MKKNYLFALLLVSCGMAAQTINFSDSAFKTKLLNGNITFDSEQNIPMSIDSNEDSEIQISEAQAITKIIISESNSLVITDLSGIEYFTNLKELYINGQNISLINLTGLGKLESFSVNESHTVSINTSDAYALRYIDCSNNQIISLDLSNNNSLESLIAIHNQLTEIDISNLSYIKFLDCSNNNLTSLNASGLADLKNIRCSDNTLISINLTGLTNLNELYCYNNQLTTLDLTGLNNLYEVVLDNNELSTIDLAFDNNIWYFSATNNALTSIDMTGCSQLYNLYLDNNQLVSLDLSENPQLANISAQNNLLNYINFKNGGNTLQLFLPQDQLYNNPDLGFVCVDENENPNVINYLNENFPDCVVSSDCSLGTNDLTLSDKINIYPNPATILLNIDVKESLSIHSFEVYNIIGRRVLEVQNPNNLTAIDITMLASGTYILKAITNKGAAHVKFIKQ